MRENTFSPNEPKKAGEKVVDIKMEPGDIKFYNFFIGPNEEYLVADYSNEKYFVADYSMSTVIGEDGNEYGFTITTFGDWIKDKKGKFTGSIKGNSDNI